MSKYLYMVNPRIPLKLNGEVIRRSKNLELNIDEVKHALKHGPVYRKFDAQNMERVTLQNIESMHVSQKSIEESVVVNVTKDEKEPEATPVPDTYNNDNGSSFNLDDITKPLEGFDTVDETISPDQEPTIDEIVKDEKEPEVTIVPDVDDNASVEQIMFEETIEDSTEVSDEEVAPNDSESVQNNNDIQPETEQVTFRPQNYQYQRNNNYRKKRKNR